PCSLPFISSSRPARRWRCSASGSQALADPVEEDAPSLLRRLDHLRWKRPRLLEPHLCPVVAEVVEDDYDDRVTVRLLLVRERQQQPRGLVDLEVFAR